MKKIKKSVEKVEATQPEQPSPPHKDIPYQDLRNPPPQDPTVNSPNDHHSQTSDNKSSTETQTASTEEDILDLENEDEAPSQRLERQVAEYEDIIKRQQAEFDNYRKRILEERHNILKYAPEAFIKKILPILGHYRQAIAQHQDEGQNERFHSFLQGFIMIKQQFDSVLEEFSIRPSTQPGDAFDPRLHQAIMMTPGNLEADSIDEIFDQGYLFHDRVIKEARVKVLQAKTKTKIDANPITTSSPANEKNNNADSIDITTQTSDPSDHIQS